MTKLLKLLKENARLSVEELAILTGRTPEDVAAEIQRLEEEKVILGYRTVIDTERVESNNLVEAFIDLKIQPKKGFGFDEFAELVSQMPEVKSCCLMSGSNDISLVVEGVGLKEIAQFVGRALAPMESVISTSTRFVLKTYKKQGCILSEYQTDERETLS